MISLTGLPYRYCSVSVYQYRQDPKNRGRLTDETVAYDDYDFLL